MLGFRIVAITFSLLMLYVVRIHFRKKHIPLLESLFWYGVWGGLIFVVVKPEILESITFSLAIYRVFDLLTIVAFMILFTFLILDRIKIYGLQKKLQDLIRNQALKEAQKK